MNDKQAILTSVAPKAYKDKETDLSILKNPTFKEHSLARSIKWVFNLPTLPKLFFHRWAFFNHVVEKSIKEGLFTNLVSGGVLHSRS